MKFLRFIADYEQSDDNEWHDRLSPLHTFPRFLERKFGIPRNLQDPIIALTLSSASPSEVRTDDALRNISRHLRSIGVFGRGFGSVIPKWGGLSEITQVGCRAAAVGGATYVLDKPIIGWQQLEQNIRVELQGGEAVTTRWLVGCDEDLTGSMNQAQTTQRDGWEWCHSISIVDAPLSSLFPPPAEGSPAPAGAVIYRPPATDSSLDLVSNQALPVYLHIHSSDTGECPSGQSKLNPHLANYFCCVQRMIV